MEQRRPPNITPESDLPECEQGSVDGQKPLDREQLCNFCPTGVALGKTALRGIMKVKSRRNSTEVRSSQKRDKLGASTDSTQTEEQRKELGLVSKDGGNTGRSAVSRAKVVVGDGAVVIPGTTHSFRLGKGTRFRKYTAKKRFG